MTHSPSRWKLIETPEGQKSDLNEIKNILILLALNIGYDILVQSDPPVTAPPPTSGMVPQFHPFKENDDCLGQTVAEGEGAAFTVLETGHRVFWGGGV